MRTLVLVAVLVGMLGCGLGTSVEEDKAAIAELLRTTNRADAQFSVDPIVVRRSYAVAGWTQGDTGGRVLLNKAGGQWKVVVNAGVEMRDTEFLARAGVPQAEAAALANVLIAAERKVPETRLAMLDRFPTKQ